GKARHGRASLHRRELEPRQRRLDRGRARERDRSLNRGGRARRSRREGRERSGAVVSPLLAFRRCRRGAPCRSVARAARARGVRKLRDVASNGAHADQYRSGPAIHRYGHPLHESRRYRTLARHRRASRRTGRRRSAPTMTKIALPGPITKGTLSLDETLTRRRSVRSFAAESVSIAEIAQRLAAAQGVTSPAGGRTAPSAGALYPLTLYLVAGRVRDLPIGVYEYAAAGHRLTIHAEGARSKRIATAALDSALHRRGRCGSRDRGRVRTNRETLRPPGGTLCAYRDGTCSAERLPPGGGFGPRHRGRRCLRRRRDTPGSGASTREGTPC